MKYEQKDDPWGSDHFPIGFEVGINKKPYKKRTNRYTTKKKKIGVSILKLSKKEEGLKKKEFRELSTIRKHEHIVKEIKEAVELATYDKIRTEETGKDVK